MAAKKKSTKTSLGKVTVKSEAYGTHTRAPRGSIKKAVLNPAMKAHGRRLRKSTIPAKMIADAIQPWRENFKGGMLWQKLVKHFAGQVKRGEDYSVKGIEHWDLNEKYRTSRIMTNQTEVKHDEEFSTIRITVNYTFSNRFLERKKSIDAFRITLIVFFPDFNNSHITAVPFVLPDKLLADTAPYAFVVDIPRHANSYLICFKAEPLKNGEIYQKANNVDICMSLISSASRE